MHNGSARRLSTSDDSNHPRPGDVLVMAGTRKGSFLFWSDPARRAWRRSHDHSDYLPGVISVNAARVVGRAVFKSGVWYNVWCQHIHGGAGGQSTMYHTVRISDETYQRILKQAQRMQTTPEAVLDQLARELDALPDDIESGEPPLDEPAATIAAPACGTTRSPGSSITPATT